MVAEGTFAAGDGLPLTFAQRRLWFLEQLEPGGARHAAETLRFVGPVDVRALQRALEEVVRRHEILRTTFAPRDGEAVQIVWPPMGWALPVTDLSALGERERGDEVRRLARAEAEAPFDLARGPLLRATLLRLGENEHALLFGAHPAVADAASRAIFAREVTALYEAFAAGAPSPLPEPAAQYHDHAVAQRRRFAAGGPAGREIDEWRERLAGAPALDLPADRPRPPIAGRDHGAIAFAWPEDLARGLSDLARERGASPFAALLAGWQAVLHRHSGQADFCVGTPAAGRAAGEAGGLIGCFDNALVLRADVTADPTFGDLVARADGEARAAFGRESVPFEWLVDELRVERNLGRNPLFQAGFAFDEAPPAGTEAAPEPGAAPAALEGADVSLIVAARAGEGLAGAVYYRADLFDAPTARRLVGHLETLLRGAVADPSLRISQLPLLTDEERRALLAWNATDADFPRERRLHELFEAQAARAPGSIALEFGGARPTTYAELDRRAERLARRLRSSGVGPGSLVGVFVERSPDLVVALLGALKAGGAYVPIDPALPAGRVEYVFEDSRPRAVVTQRPLRARLPATDAAVFCLDDAEFAADGGGAAAAPEGGVGPRPPGSPGDLAYVIYTSGSTGRPKGVAVEHCAVVNLVTALGAALAFAPADRLLALTTVSFDIAGLELFMPLAAGGTIVLAGRDDAGDAGRLRALLEASGATFLQATPAACGLLVDAGWRAGAPLAILCGGDTLPCALADELLARGASLRNMYGPTETTIWSTFDEVGPGEAPITVGRPIANTRLYVVDPAGRPAPVGVPGELLIGGAGLARGYFNRPALTAEKFIPDPFGAPGGRLYRTGDLARYRADGRVEHLGRNDFQIKLRGFRIELGEIEAVLGRHPSVRACAVVAREDEPGAKRLVAYVVSERGGAPPNAAELRAHLGAKVPEYMVPAAFVALDALPLSPNGKLDRRALPAPDGARPELGRPYAPPRTEAEAALAEIWRQLLGLDRVGVDDDFFSLGGDSIVSLRVASRAKRAGLELAPRDFFRHRTVAEQAAAARHAAAAPAEAASSGEAPLTPFQRWFFDTATIDPHHWNFSELSRPTPALDPATLERAFAALVDHHDTLRLRYARGPGGAVRQFFAEPGAPAPFAAIDLSAVAPERLDEALAGEVLALQTSLSLERGPLLRAALFDLGARGKRLLVTIHHLAVDGVSWRILRDDLAHACGQLLAGKPIDLGPRTTTFQRWGAALVEHVRAGKLDGELPHWLDLAARPVAPLPVDHDRGPCTRASVRTVAASLSAEETRRLLRGADRGRQAQEALVAALVCALRSWTGRDEFVVDLMGHGRDPIVAGLDLSRTVGWFSNFYPVAFRAAAAGPAALAGAAAAMRAVPNGGLGYNFLRYYHPDPTARARLAAVCSYQIRVNYLGQFDATLGGFLEPAPESPQPERSPRGLTQWKLDLVAKVAAGRLEAHFRYSDNQYRRESIEALMADYARALRNLSRIDSDDATPEGAAHVD